jgi:hypothetical protein
MVNYRTVYVYVKSGKPTINRASNKSWVQSILYHIIGISWGYEAISLYYIQNLQRTARQEHSLPSHYLSGSFLVGGNDRVRIHHPISGMLSFIVPQCSHLTDPDKFGMFGCHDVMFFLKKCDMALTNKPQPARSFTHVLTRNARGDIDPLNHNWRLMIGLPHYPEKMGERAVQISGSLGLTLTQLELGQFQVLGEKELIQTPKDRFKPGNSHRTGGVLALHFFSKATAHRFEPDFKCGVSDLTAIRLNTEHPEASTFPYFSILLVHTHAHTHI